MTRVPAVDGIRRDHKLRRPDRITDDLGRRDCASSAENRPSLSMKSTPGSGMIRGIGPGADGVALAGGFLALRDIVARSRFSPNRTRGSERADMPSSDMGNSSLSPGMAMYDCDSERRQVIL